MLDGLWNDGFILHNAAEGAQYLPWFPSVDIPIRQLQFSYKHILLASNYHFFEFIATSKEWTLEELELSNPIEI
jgi:hypothetical protein